MGWGCYKHEWDEESEAWKAAYAKLSARKLKESPRSFGRDNAVCPACYEELDSAHAKLRSEIERALREAWACGYVSYVDGAEKHDNDLRAEQREWIAAKLAEIEGVAALEAKGTEHG